MARQTITERRTEAASKAEDLISEATELVSGLYQALEEIRSNMEEKFSQTDKYQRLEELVFAVEETHTALELAQSKLPSDFQYT